MSGGDVSFERIEELFHQALDLAPDERRAFLDQRAEPEPELVAEVLVLLDADAVAEQAVEQCMAGALEKELGDDDAEPVPERVGAYRILHELGRGGLSTVYLAERDDHFQKRVAVKLVRRGLDTDDVLLRFRHERQILAGFEHANIARLIDGGSTEDGRPFFVMEHVDGEPIDEHCARHELGLRERLELFRSVCAAVSYAHRNLVVHRDLKPSNILVTDDGQPKLLDFGIAKLLSSEEFAATRPMTEKGFVLLTPEFASPEQVLGHNPTTQTDVYSLAVVLYRLLTGAPPYILRSRAELIPTICEVVPPKVSTASMDAESLSRAGLPVEPRKLRRRLAGDLDTILSKALHKEPARRYGSVEQLSEDLRRHLDGERVLARPESWGYRVAKFIGRNRAVASALAAAAVLLMVVVGFYTFQLREQRDVARSEATKAKQVSSLLVSMLEISDPSRTQGESVTALELLGRAADRLEIELAGQPEVRVTLMELIGTIYSNLGLYDEAMPLLQEAADIHQRAGTPPELADVLARLGELHYNTGDYEKAEPILRRALRQRIETLGPDHALVGISQADLAAVFHARGEYQEAEGFYRRAQAIFEATPTNEPRERLLVGNNYAMLLQALGRPDEAEALARRTLERQKAALGERHPDVTLTENTLAFILIAAKKRQQAEPLLRAGLARQKELYGEQHPKVAAAMVNLGLVLYHRRKFDEAETLYRQALAIEEQAPGVRRQTATILKNLADIELYGRKDDRAGAELMRRGLDVQQRLFRTAHPELSVTLLRLGLIELRLGEHEQARERLDQALKIHHELEPDVPERQRKFAQELRAGLDAAGGAG